MKIFVTCASCGHAIQLNSRPSTRAGLPSFFTLACPQCGETHSYVPAQAHAVTDSAAAAGGAVAGGLIGFLGGPLGMIIGGLVGGALGANADAEDQAMVRRFNQS